jgi:hypothetical protein
LENGNHATASEAKKVIDHCPLSPNPSTIMAKANSGASSHCFKLNDQKVVADLPVTHFRPNVVLPDSTNMQAANALWIAAAPPQHLDEGQDSACLGWSCKLVACLHRSIT